MTDMFHCSHKISFILDIIIIDLCKIPPIIYTLSSGGSCIIWPGRNVDSKMVTLIGGFIDGVVRVMCLDQAEQESQYDLKIVLQHVFKPHKGEVTAMVVDDEGRTLVTGSKDDSTLFFFDIKSNYMPIGFLKVDAPVTTMAWSTLSVSETKVVIVLLLIVYHMHNI